MADPKRVALPLTAIKVVPAIQARTKLDEGKIEEYRQILKDVGEMDPVDCFVNVDKENLLADGAHRLEAYSREGRKEIPAFIHKGNPESAASDALEFSIRKNNKHGKRFTNVDKHRAVILALEDARMRRWPDNKLATMCCVSPNLIAKARKLGTQAFAEPATKRKSVAVTKHVRATPSTKPKQSDHGTAQEPLPAVDFKIGLSEQAIKQLRDWIDDGTIDFPTIARMFDTEKQECIMMAKAPWKLIVVSQGKKITSRVIAYTALETGMEVECAKELKG